MLATVFREHVFARRHSSLKDLAGVIGFILVSLSLGSYSGKHCCLLGAGRHIENIDIFNAILYNK